MIIEITVRSNSSEYSTHLRRGLVKLLRKLAEPSDIILGEGGKYENEQEWIYLSYDGPAPEEKKVDSIFAVLD